MNITVDIKFIHCKKYSSKIFVTYKEIEFKIAYIYISLQFRSNEQRIYARIKNIHILQISM